METRSSYRMCDDSFRAVVEMEVSKNCICKCEKIVFIWMKNDVIEIFKATPKRIIIVCNFNM